MGYSQLRFSVSLAVILSGIAFIVFAILYPIMINEIALIEEELSIHRNEFNEISNKMWSEILQQSTIIRHIRAIERKRRQYGYSDYERSNGDRGSTGGPETIAAGKSCPAGPKGSNGDRGERGEDGLDGYPGKPGLDGIAIEPTSGSCAPCPPGPIGLPGYKGRRGSRGPKGQKGAQGKPGRDGVMGDEGPEGDRGYQGDVGPRGEKGPPGKSGIKGRKGPRGPKGETGPIGPEGDEGIPGERGEDAPAGSRGEEGPRGTPGKRGRPGPPGKSGIPGQKGADGEYCPCPDRLNEGGNRQTGNKHAKGRPRPRPFDNANRQDSYSTYDGNDRRLSKGSNGSSKNAYVSDNEAIKWQQIIDERGRIEEVDNDDAESLSKNIDSIQTDQLFNERNRGPIRNNIDAYNKRTRAAALRRKHL